MKFEKQTYTQTPNSLFIAMKEMDECELKVVMLICRYTFGYHRDEVKLSTRRIADEIGMNTASVQKGADKAIERGLIEKVIDGNKTTTWRALVSDSEIESPMYQKLNRGVSDNESLSRVKESNKEINKDDDNSSPIPKDLVDGILELSQAPGIKREARINDILNYLGVTFRRNTSTKEWLTFAKYIDSEFQSKGWDVKQFVSWLFGQKDYNPNYWPVKKMMEFYPSAFVTPERDPRDKSFAL